MTKRHTHIPRYSGKIGRILCYTMWPNMMSGRSWKRLILTLIKVGLSVLTHASPRKHYWLWDHSPFTCDDRDSCFHRPTTHVALWCCLLYQSCSESWLHRGCGFSDHVHHWSDCVRQSLVGGGYYATQSPTQMSHPRPIYIISTALGWCRSW